MTGRLRPSDYNVAWLAVLPIEAEVARGMLDRRHDGYFKTGDYLFKGGEIAGHNVVLATFPAGENYGGNNVSALVNQMKSYFTNIKFALLVGVAAGLPNFTAKDPSRERDIRLGDVLVCVPDDTCTGVIQYDLGRNKGDGEDSFELVGRTAEAPRLVRNAISMILADGRHKQPCKKGGLLAGHLDAFRNSLSGGGNTEGVDRFSCPPQDQDVLYSFSDDPKQQPTIIIRKPRRAEARTHIWYGRIGSGNTLMRNARERDALRDRYNLIGFEMEAAGVVNSIPTCVIRGVCDYADPQKNKLWQPYAAAVAAAYAKEILCCIPPDSGRIDDREHQQSEAPASSVQPSIDVEDVYRDPLHYIQSFGGEAGEDARQLLELLAKLSSETFPTLAIEYAWHAAQDARHIPSPSTFLGQQCSWHFENSVSIVRANTYQEFISRFKKAIELLSKHDLLIICTEEESLRLALNPGLKNWARSRREQQTSDRVWLSCLCVMYLATCWATLSKKDTTTLSQHIASLVETSPAQEHQRPDRLLIGTLSALIANLGPDHVEDGVTHFMDRIFPDLRLDLPTVNARYAALYFWRSKWLECDERRDEALAISTQLVRLADQHLYCHDQLLLQLGYHCAELLIATRDLFEASVLLHRLIEAEKGSVSRTSKYIVLCHVSLAAIYIDSRHDRAIELLEDVLNKPILNVQADPRELLERQKASLYQYPIRSKTSLTKPTPRISPIESLDACYYYSMSLNPQVLLLALYRRTGNLENSSRLVQNVMHSLEESQGQGHFDAEVIESMIDYHATFNEYSEAIELQSWFIKMIKAKCQWNTKDEMKRFYKAHFDLVGLYEFVQDWNAAKTTLDEIIAIQKKYLGAKHPDTLATQQEKAEMYLKTRQYTQASSLLEYIISVTSPGEVKLLRQKLLVRVHLKSGDFDRARLIQRDVIDTTIGLYHKFSVQSMEVQLELAWMFKSSGNSSEALSTVQRLEALISVVPMDQAVEKSTVLAEMGKIYKELDVVDSALRVLENAYQIHRQSDMGDEYLRLAIAQELEECYALSRRYQAGYWLEGRQELELQNILEHTDVEMTGIS